MASGVGLADQLIEGVGIAGTPNGGVVTIQGDPNGVSINVPPTSSSVVVLPSATRTVSQYNDLRQTTGAGIRVTINVSAVTATGSLQINVYAVDDLSGISVQPPILSSPAITAVGAYMMTIYPGLVASANLVANDAIGNHFAIQVVHANAVNMTYSIGYQIIP